MTCKCQENINRSNVFAQVPAVLIDIGRYELSDNAVRIMSYFLTWRGDPSHEFPLSEIVKAIGMSKNYRKKGLKELMNWGLVEVVKKHTNLDGAVYRCKVFVEQRMVIDESRPLEGHDMTLQSVTIEPSGGSQYDPKIDNINKINNISADSQRTAPFVEESLKEEIIEAFKEELPDCIQDTETFKAFKKHKQLARAVKDLPTIKHWRAIFAVLAKKMKEDTFWTKQGRKTAITYFLQRQKNSNIPQWILWYKDAPQEYDAANDKELTEFLKRNGYI